MKRILPITTFILITVLTFSQSNIYLQWNHAYGGFGEDNGYSILQTEDNGYVFTGSAYGYNPNELNGDVVGFNGNEDVFTVKTSNDGKIEWTKCYGGSNVDDGYAIKQTFDGGYILCGSTQSNDGDISSNRGASDVWLIKIDNEGEIEWERCYGGSKYDMGYSIQITPDSGYVFCGHTQSDNGDVHSSYDKINAWVVRTDRNGDTLWTRCLGGNGDDWATAITVTHDSCFLVAGYSDSFNKNGSMDGWFFKLNWSGKLLFSASYGGDSEDKFNSVECTPDSGILLGGYSWSDNGHLPNNFGFSDLWVVKLSRNYKVVWSKNYGGESHERFGNIKVWNDSTYFLYGTTYSSTGMVHGFKGCEDAYLLGLKPDGDTLWTSCYGGTSYEFVQSASATSDGQMVMVGSTQSTDGDVIGHHFNGGNNDFWVFKISAVNQDRFTICSGDSIQIGGIWHNKEGVYTDTLRTCSGLDSLVNKYVIVKECLTSVSENKPKKGINIYPNPVTNNLIIESSETNYYVLYDLNGRIVLEGKSSIIDVSALVRGVYFLYINSNLPVMRKIIKI